MKLWDDLRQDFPLFLGQTLGAILGHIVAGIIWIEKRIFWMTGRRGWVLSWYWRRQGDRLQRALNREHGTEIKYGYIAK